MSKRKDKGDTENPAGEGILHGLTTLIDKLNELAKTGKELRESGEFGGGEGERKWRGVYGVRVRNLGDETPGIEPFGNLHRQQGQDYMVTPEVLEPLVDIFEEADYTLVVAEVPGVSLEDVRVEIEDDILTLEAANDQKKYRKEVLLPRPYSAEQLKVSCNNGILEIRCLKSGESQ
ncbi:Hsp20/alpha crystallin family protein [Methylohalobius crimeensis]|uniref:Hsp20/alpha crystallin family protein n=1 Tax=Methylohalobius crimeensis TaxID=244365 RepID=UPI0003B36467|nr:Hsp20/alpha crystallin family protein [Methylohalobius crimeensis]